MGSDSDDASMRRHQPTLVGRYEVLHPIGRGGMGSLYLARDPAIGDRPIVIKLLREGFNTPSLRQRFAREAQAAGAMSHINIVTIYDVGEYESGPFIAMEYIEGETLTDVVARRPVLTVTRKIELMEELCAGLQYAHRAGIIHRDIKPANVMVDQGGVLKILDFGIARRGGASQMTMTGAVIGTLNYMAPEQMGGQPLDTRADMFSAGAVFYELLTYTQAFPGEPPAIFNRILTAAHEPLARLQPDLDVELVAVVERCLACDREDRYPDMASVRRDLASIRERIQFAEQREEHYKRQAQANAATVLAPTRADETAPLDLELDDIERRRIEDEQEIEARRQAAGQGQVTPAPPPAPTPADHTIRLDPKVAASDALKNLRDPSIESVGRRKLESIASPVPLEPIAAPAPVAPVEPRRPRVAPPAPKPLPIAAIAIAAALLLLAVAGVIIWRTRTPPAPAMSLVIDVAPWAQIAAITRPDGSAVGSSNLVTPCVVQLPAGNYHIRALNPDYPPLEADFTVSAQGPGKIRFEMPGLDIEKEALSIVNR